MRLQVSHRASRSLVKMESSDGEEWGREDRGGVQTEISKAPDVQGWSCTKCQTRYTEKENYITHMSEEHGKVSASSQQELKLEL